MAKRQGSRIHREVICFRHAAQGIFASLIRQRLMALCSMRGLSTGIWVTPEKEIGCQVDGNWLPGGWYLVGRAAEP